MILSTLFDRPSHPMTPMFSRTQLPLWAVATAHFAVDMLNSINSVVLTFMSAHLMALSKTQIGLAISLYALTGSFSQPLFGWLADKTGGKYLGTLAVVWQVGLLITAYVVGAATGSYELIVVLFILSSLGSGAFHPVGALHAVDTQPSRAARNLSFFFLAGQLGLGFGPAFVGWLLEGTLRDGSTGSLSPLPFLALFAIPGVLAMARLLPSPQRYTEAHPPSTDTDSSFSSIPLRPLLFLAIVVALRSLANPGSAVFIPVLFEERGWSAEHYGQITSLYWIAGALTAVTITPLADRFGSRAIIGVTMLLGAPMFWLLPRVDGGAALLVALLAGGFTGASHSLIVAEGQRLMPARKGFAAGATLGFIFGMGAIGSLILGALSDRIGVGGAFEVVALVTVIAAAMGWVLPETAPKQKPVVDVAAQAVD